MALYMFFHALPDSHLHYLSEHPEAFHPYMEGRVPEPKRSLLDKLLGREVENDLPDDWPEEALEGYSPEINDKQVKQFHYLLNGTEDRVAHSGCVFQTWFAPRHKSVAITIDGENFALLNEQIPELAERLKAATGPQLTERYRQANNGETLSTQDEEYLRNAFSEIAAACEKALSQRAGLMWTFAG